MTHSRRRAGAESGITLMELLIAMSLSTFVFIGIMSIAAYVARAHFDGIRRGNVTALSLYALQQMHKEIESASYLNLPPGPGLTWGDVLAGCHNYSAAQSPGFSTTIDASAPVISFYYCKTSNSHATFPDSLMRYEKSGSCPFSPAPSPCGNNVTGATRNVVIYKNFFNMDGWPNIFYRGSSERTLTVAYIVGQATPTPNIPIPVAYKFVANLNLNKAMFNSTD